MHVQEARANIKSSTITDVKLGVLVSGPGADRAYLRYARDSRPLLVPIRPLFFPIRPLYSLLGLFYSYIDVLGRNGSAHLARTRKGCGSADCSKPSRVLIPKP